MSAVKLPKVSLYEFGVLQYQVENYPASLYVKEHPNDYLLAYDIGTRLWKAFRTRIENNKPLQTMSIKVNEAVILMRACAWMPDDPTGYQRHVARKFIDLIDQQLKSIHIFVENPEPLKLTE